MSQTRTLTLLLTFSVVSPPLAGAQSAKFRWQAETRLLGQGD